MNNMRALIIICLAIILLTACSPSPLIIQTAIAQTQAAWSPTPTSTYSPTPISTPKPTLTFKECTTLPTKDISSYIPPTGLSRTNPSGVNLKSGKYHLIYFWNEHCIGCLEEAPDMYKLHEMYSDTLTLATLDTGDPRVQLITSELGMAGMTTPSFYIVDPNGKTVMNWSGLIDWELIPKYIELAICYPENGPYKLNDDGNGLWEIQSTWSKKIDRYDGTYRFFWFFDRNSEYARLTQPIVRALQGKYGDRIAFLFVDRDDPKYINYIEKYTKNIIEQFVLVGPKDNILESFPLSSLDTIHYSLLAQYMKIFNEDSAPIQQFDTNLDWTGINPVLTDSKGDSKDGPDKDMTAVYMTMDNDYWYFKVETAENRSQEGAQIELEFSSSDRMGKQVYTGIIIRPIDPHAYFYPNDKRDIANYNEIPGSKVGWSNVTELALPKDFTINDGTIQITSLVWNVLGPNGYFTADSISSNEISQLPSDYLTTLMDGSAQGWSGYQSILTDVVGDSKDGPHTDLIALYQTTDKKYLYIMIKTQEKIISTESELDIWLDTKIGGQCDLSNIGITVHPNQNTAVIWDYSDCQIGTNSQEIKGSVVVWKDVVSILLPLSSLGAYDHIYIPRVSLNIPTDGSWHGADGMIRP